MAGPGGPMSRWSGSRRADASSVDPSTERRRHLRAPRPVRRASALALVWLGASGVAACAPFDDLERDVCGNRIVELAREDCDGSLEAGLGQGLSCRPPGAVAECRLDCSAAGALCPEGMRCGTDSVCRATTGLFAQPVVLDPTEVADLRGVDFDGDRRDDVIALRSEGLVVARLDDARATSETSLLGAISMPALGALDDDALVDLVWADAGAILARGAAEEGVVVTPVPSLLVGEQAPLYLVDALPLGTSGLPLDLRGDEPVAWNERDRRFELQLRTEAPVPLGSLDAGLDAWVELPVPDAGRRRAVLSADLIEGPTSPCEELVVVHARALASDAIASVVSLCRDEAGAIVPNAGVGAVPVVEIEPQGGDALSGGALVVDLNLDGHLDVALRGTESLFVAYGDGTGQFHDSPCLGSPTNVAVPIVAGKLEGFGGNVSLRDARVLADFDGDGCVDVANGSGVRFARSCVSDDPTCPSAPFHVLEPFAAASPTFAGGWLHVAAGDFDGDGSLDLVGARDSSVNEGVDFFAGGGERSFTYTRLDPGAPTRGLVVGDFDGDGLHDLAQLSALSDTEDRVLALFGRAFEAPTDVVTLGDLPRVEALDVGDVVVGTTAFDAASELVTTSSLADGSLAVTLFVGASSRQLYAPFFCPIPGEPLGRAGAFRVAMGGLLEGGAPSVAMLAVSPQVAESDRVWFASASEGALDVAGDAFVPAGPLGLASVLEDAQLIGPGEPGAVHAALVFGAMSAADTDGDGTDELYLLSFHFVPGEEPLGLLARLGPPGASPDVAGALVPPVFATLDDRAGKPTDLIAKATSVVTPMRTRVRALDLDGDGDDELVANGALVEGASACSSAGVLTIIAPAAGGDALAPESTFVLAPPSDELGFRFSYASFDLLDVDGDGDLEIVALAKRRSSDIVGSCAPNEAAFPPDGPAELVVIDVRPVVGQPASTWELSEPVPLASVSEALIVSSRAIAVGDLTGDGIDDVMLGGLEGLSLVAGLDEKGVTP
jgi:hypothetical protein